MMIDILRKYFLSRRKRTPPACLLMGFSAVPITGDHWIAVHPHLQMLCQRELPSFPFLARQNHPHDTGGDFTDPLSVVKKPLGLLGGYISRESDITSRQFLAFRHFIFQMWNRHTSPDIPNPIWQICYHKNAVFYKKKGARKKLAWSLRE